MVICCSNMGSPMIAVTVCILSVISAALGATAPPAATTASNIIQCRYCNRASRLSDCNKLVTCDSTLEDCYMDELITDQLTVVYNGGCRSKQVCSQASGKRKKADVIACSRCCNFAKDCNKRLCGIKDDTLNTSQCYSCDHRNSEQSEVVKPESCVTLEACQDNEMCYTIQQDLTGSNTFFYGCYSKQVCIVLMRRAYEDWMLCEKNITKPDPGYTWEQLCGSYHTNLGKRSDALCHSCCNYGGCNYGTCHEQNDRLFTLAQKNQFDMKTLKLIGP